MYSTLSSSSSSSSLSSSSSSLSRRPVGSTPSPTVHGSTSTNSHRPRGYSSPNLTHTRPRVQIVYDYGSLPATSTITLDRILSLLLHLATNYGELTSFTLPVLTSTPSFDSAAKQLCRDHGVQVEEIGSNESSVESFILTRLMRLTLELQQSSSSTSSPMTIILLSNQPSIAGSLTLMRQSSLFAHVILIHGSDAPVELRASATSALTFAEFLAGLLPRHKEMTSFMSSSLPTNSPPGFSSNRRPSSLATSPVDEMTPSISLLGFHPTQHASAQPSSQSSTQLSSSQHLQPPLAHSPRGSSPHPSPQGLLPTPARSQSPGMRFFGTHTSSLSLPLHSPSPSSKFKGKMASSAPSSPTHRSFFPSTSSQSPSHQFQPFPHRGVSDRHPSYPSHSQAASSRTRACLNAYNRIIAYCESEKLIPRESVLKKRLVDSKLQLNEAGGNGIEFEEFLSTIIAAGVGVLEGEPPQRIVWPRGSDGQARHFACADFFTPVSRLSQEQNAELLEFLYTVQPEVERGRFGMANWLAAHGPPFVRLLAHGVLVELVQLLLNRKVLLFRKGRVSVASRSEANEAASLGMLFNATDFQTPAPSRGTSPVRTRNNSPTHEEDETIWDPKGREEIWKATGQTNPNQADRPLLQGGTSGGNTQVYSSFKPIPTSYSLPVSRAGSPVRSTLSENNRLHGVDELSSKSLRPMIKSAHGLETRGGGFESITTIGAASTTDSQLSATDDLNNKPLWLKEDRPGSGVAASFTSSRRSSLSDIDSWRSGNHTSSILTAPFESSTGFVGESMDACDPAAVLSVKLARLNSEYIAQSALASGDELARFTAALQFRPCFHFEKSGAAHTPEWVCFVAFSIGTKRFEMKSSIHSKKDGAKNEVCMKVLQMLEDGSIDMAPHTDASKQADAVDSVIDLARLLNFLQQAPVVYYLTRSQPTSRFDSRTGRRYSSGSMSMPGNGLWNGSTRIQVKSVNVVTGEAQPTVSASTPFTHTVTATTKTEAKELIAASLLRQIQAARVVNPALFTVLSAARNAPLQAAPQPTNSSSGSSSTSIHPSTSSSSNDTIWRHSGSAPPAPIGAPSHNPSNSVLPVPSVDMTRIGGPSLFSMHTPIGGPYGGNLIPSPTMTPSTLSAALSPLHSLPSSFMTRSISESLNAEAEQISAASAEKALQETPVAFI